MKSLHQKYTVETLLGKGGMGSVWRVVDNTLLRTVACKMLHQNKSADLDERENFLVEGQISAQAPTSWDCSHLRVR